MNELFVALLLGGAACMDLIDKKIKNIWLLFWLGTGVVYHGPKFFIAVIISFIPLFLLYRFRMVGAGDAKLIMLLCGFLGLFEGAGVVFVGMCFAAIYSFYLLYSKKILFFLDSTWRCFYLILIYGGQCQLKLRIFYLKCIRIKFI